MLAWSDPKGESLRAENTVYFDINVGESIC